MYDPRDWRDELLKSLGIVVLYLAVGLAAYGLLHLAVYGDWPPLR